MKIRVNNRKLKYILVVFMAMIGAFMFHVDASENMDFVRYQDILQSIRNTNISFIDFWLNGTQVSRWAGTAQIYAYGENILVYLVAKFCSNDYILEWISVLIDYSCVAYIAFDLKKNSKYSSEQVFVAILICFAELPFIQACSGLRTATAACIMAVAIYDYLYKNEHTCKFIILSIVAVSFHPFVLFAVVIALVVNLVKNRIVIVGVLISMVCIPNIVNTLARSNFAFLTMLAQKYTTYTSENQFRAYRTFQYGTLILCVIFILYLWIIYRSSEKVMIDCDRLRISATKKIRLFLIGYMFAIIGNISSYELVVRMGYLLGALAPVLTVLLYEKGKNKNEYILSVLIRICIILLVTYMSITYIRYYYRFYL